MRQPFTWEHIDEHQIAEVVALQCVQGEISYFVAGNLGLNRRRHTARHSTPRRSTQSSRNPAGRRFCSASSAVSAYLPDFPDLRGLPDLPDVQQYLQDPARPGAIDRFDAAIQAEARGNQRLHDDAAGLERCEGLVERAASRANQADLVDDERCPGQCLLPRHGGLQHNRAARAHELERGGQARVRSRAVHNDIGLVPGFGVVHSRRSNAKRFQERELFIVLSDHEDVVCELREHLSAQVPQAAVTEHDDAIGPMDADLRGYLKRGRHWLGEDRDVGWQRIRNEVQISLGQDESVRKCPVAIGDAERGPVRAMSGKSLSAGRTCSAAAVDLAHDTAAGKRSRLGDADELVAEHAAKCHVSANQLQIGFADAGAQHAHNHLAVLRYRVRMRRAQVKRLVQHDRSHVVNTIRSSWNRNRAVSVRPMSRPATTINAELAEPAEKTGLVLCSAVSALNVVPCGRVARLTAVLHYVR
jgi:hypothetical protein